MDKSVWESFLCYLERGPQSQLNCGNGNTTIVTTAIVVDNLDVQNASAGGSFRRMAKASETIDLHEPCEFGKEQNIVVLSSDSETDDESIWSSNAKCKGYKRLWEKARSLMFHRLLPDYFRYSKHTSKVQPLDKVADEHIFPYEEFRQLAEDLQIFQQGCDKNEKELNYLWSNVLQWLLALKQSFDPMDLNYDEKFNLILIDFMVEYFNYITNLFSNIHEDEKIKEKICELIKTLTVILNGNTLQILLVLLRIELKLEYRSLLDPIFRKYLTDRNLCQTSNDLVIYLRLIFCFKRWKMITPLKTDREAINEIAVGKSLRMLRGQSMDEVTDLTTDSILPKAVPKVNVRNKSFISISDLIGFAIERKAIGTRILLVYTSLDLEDAISKYFNLYERYISRNANSVAEVSTVLSENVHSLCLGTSNICDDTLMTHHKRTPNSDVATIFHSQRRREHQSTSSKLKVSGHNCQRDRSTLHQQHLYTDCDTNKNRLSTRTNYNVSRKTTNTQSDISLSLKGNSNTSSHKNINIIEIDLSDDEDIQSSSLNPNISLENSMCQEVFRTDCSKRFPNSVPQIKPKNNKSQMSYTKRQTIRKEQEKSNVTNKINIRNTTSVSNEIVLTLTSSSSDDDNNSSKLTSDTAHRPNMNTISKISNENTLGLDQSLPRIAAIPPRCRPLVESVVTKPTRKEKHCIPGEVSSTTSPDCGMQNINEESTLAIVPTDQTLGSSFHYNHSNLEVHSAGILQNAREVGVVKAVEQRLSPCPPVVVSGTCKPGSLLLGIDYSDVSSDNDDDIESGCRSRILSRGSWKVVEEATSSTSEFPKVLPENLLTTRSERPKIKNETLSSDNCIINKTYLENENEPHQRSVEIREDLINKPICSKHIEQNIDEDMTTKPIVCTDDDNGVHVSVPVVAIVPPPNISMIRNESLIVEEIKQLDKQDSALEESIEKGKHDVIETEKCISENESDDDTRQSKACEEVRENLINSPICSKYIENDIDEDMTNTIVSADDDNDFMKLVHLDHVVAPINNLKIRVQHENHVSMMDDSIGSCLQSVTEVENITTEIYTHQIAPQLKSSEKAKKDNITRSVSSQYIENHMMNPMVSKDDLEQPVPLDPAIAPVNGSTIRQESLVVEVTDRNVKHDCERETEKNTQNNPEQIPPEPRRYEGIREDLINKPICSKYIENDIVRLVPKVSSDDYNSAPLISVISPVCDTITKETEKIRSESKHPTSEAKNDSENDKENNCQLLLNISCEMNTVEYLNINDNNIDFITLSSSNKVRDLNDETSLEKETISESFTLIKSAELENKIRAEKANQNIELNSQNSNMPAFENSGKHNNAQSVTYSSSDKIEEMTDNTNNNNNIDSADFEISDNSTTLEKDDLNGEVHMFDEKVNAKELDGSQINTTIYLQTDISKQKESNVMEKATKAESKSENKITFEEENILNTTELIRSSDILRKEPNDIEIFLKKIDENLKESAIITKIQNVPAAIEFDFKNTDNLEKEFDALKETISNSPKYVNISEEKSLLKSAMDVNKFSVDVSSEKEASVSILLDNVKGNQNNVISLSSNKTVNVSYKAALECMKDCSIDEKKSVDRTLVDIANIEGTENDHIVEADITNDGNISNKEVEGEASDEKFSTKYLKHIEDDDHKLDAFTEIKETMNVEKVGSDINNDSLVTGGEFNTEFYISEEVGLVEIVDNMKGKDSISQRIDESHREAEVKTHEIIVTPESKFSPEKHQYDLTNESSDDNPPSINETSFNETDIQTNIPTKDINSLPCETISDQIPESSDLNVVNISDKSVSDVCTPNETESRPTNTDEIIECLNKDSHVLKNVSILQCHDIVGDIDKNRDSSDKEQVVSNETPTKLDESQLIYEKEMCSNLNQKEVALETQEKSENVLQQIDDISGKDNLGIEKEVAEMLENSSEGYQDGRGTPLLDEETDHLTKNISDHSTVGNKIITVFKYLNEKTAPLNSSCMDNSAASNTIEYQVNKENSDTTIDIVVSEIHPLTDKPETNGFQRCTSSITNNTTENQLSNIHTDTGNNTTVSKDLHLSDKPETDGSQECISSITNDTTADVSSKTSNDADNEIAGSEIISLSDKSITRDIQQITSITTDKYEDRRSNTNIDTGNEVIVSEINPLCDKSGADDIHDTCDGTSSITETDTVNDVGVSKILPLSDKSATNGLQQSTSSTNNSCEDKTSTTETGNDVIVSKIISVGHKLETDEFHDCTSLIRNDTTEDQPIKTDVSIILSLSDKSETHDIQKETSIATDKSEDTRSNTKTGTGNEVGVPTILSLRDKSGTDDVQKQTSIITDQNEDTPSNTKTGPGNDVVVPKMLPLSDKSEADEVQKRTSITTDKNEDTRSNTKIGNGNDVGVSKESPRITKSDTDNDVSVSKIFPVSDKLDTDDIQQRTPWKMRIKRRISQCSDIIKEFDLESDERINKKSSSGEGSKAVRPLTSPTLTKATEELALTISKLELKRKKSESDDDDDYDEYLQYENSWFSKLGLYKNSSKNIQTNTFKDLEKNEKSEGRRKKPKVVRQIFNDSNGSKTELMKSCTENSEPMEQISTTYNSKEILAVTALINMQTKYCNERNEVMPTHDESRTNDSLISKGRRTSVRPKTRAQSLPGTVETTLVTPEPLKTILKSAFKDKTNSNVKKCVTYDEHALLLIEQNKRFRKSSKAKAFGKLRAIRSAEGALLKGGNKHIQKRLAEINAVFERESITTAVNETSHTDGKIVLDQNDENTQEKNASENISESSARSPQYTLPEPTVPILIEQVTKIEEISESNSSPNVTPLKDCNDVTKKQRSCKKKLDRRTSINSKESLTNILNSDEIDLPPHDKGNSTTNSENIDKISNEDEIFQKVELIPVALSTTKLENVTKESFVLENKIKVESCEVESKTTFKTKRAFVRMKRLDLNQYVTNGSSIKENATVEPTKILSECEIKKEPIEEVSEMRLNPIDIDIKLEENSTDSNGSLNNVQDMTCFQFNTSIDQKRNSKEIILRPCDVILTAEIINAQASTIKQTSKNFKSGKNITKINQKLKFFSKSDLRKPIQKRSSLLKSDNNTEKTTQNDLNVNKIGTNDLDADEHAKKENVTNVKISEAVCTTAMKNDCIGNRNSVHKEKKQDEHEITPQIDNLSTASGSCITKKNVDVLNIVDPEESADKMTEDVIAELKLLSPDSIMSKKTQCDFDEDDDIAKKLDRGIEMVLGSKGTSTDKNDALEDDEQKTAELLDSAIEKVLGNSLTSIEEPTTQDLKSQKDVNIPDIPKSTKEQLDLAIDAILGTKNSQDHKCQETEKPLPIVRKLDILTAERINSSIEKILENNKVNDVEHKTAETLDQSIETILGIKDTSFGTAMTNPDEDVSKKAINKQFTDMKIVSANVPEALFADDDSDNSNSGETSTQDNLKFFTPILSLDDLLTKKDDPVINISTNAKDEEQESEKEPSKNSSKIEETRHCLGTPNFTVELEVETSKKFETERSTVDSIDEKEHGNVADISKPDTEELTTNLEETNTANLENFVLSSISDISPIGIPIDFNMSNVSFPDVLDIMLLDQVQESIDCMISGNNYIQKWAPDNYTAIGSLKMSSENVKENDSVSTQEHPICISQILDSNTSGTSCTGTASIGNGRENFLSTINPLDEVEVSTNIGFDLVGNVTVEDLLADDGDDLFAFSELDKTHSRSNSFSNESENGSNSAIDEHGNIALTTKSIACDHSYNKDINKEQHSTESSLTVLGTTKSKTSSPCTKSISSLAKSPPSNSFTKLKSHPAPYWKVRKPDDTKTSPAKREDSTTAECLNNSAKILTENMVESTTKLEAQQVRKQLFYNMPELDLGPSTLKNKSKNIDKNEAEVNGPIKNINNNTIDVNSKKLDTVNSPVLQSDEIPDQIKLSPESQESLVETKDQSKNNFKEISRSSTPIEITEVITIPAPVIINQPIITIQSQTNRLQRLDPIITQDKTNNSTTNSLTGSNILSITQISEREPTPTLDEPSKEVEIASDSNPSMIPKLLKREGTPTLDEPPEKKACLDESSKNLSSDDIFDMLKRETPINSVVCKSVFEKIDVSDDSNGDIINSPPSHSEEVTVETNVGSNECINDNNIRENITIPECKKKISDKKQDLTKIDKVNSECFNQTESNLNPPTPLVLKTDISDEKSDEKSSVLESNILTEESEKIIEKRCSTFSAKLSGTKPVEKLDDKSLAIESKCLTEESDKIIGNVCNPFLVRSNNSSTPVKSTKSTNVKTNGQEVPGKTIIELPKIPKLTEKASDNINAVGKKDGSVTPIVNTIDMAMISPINASKQTVHIAPKPKAAIPCPANTSKSNTKIYSSPSPTLQMNNKYHPYQHSPTNINRNKYNYQRSSYPSDPKQTSKTNHTTNTPQVKQTSKQTEPKHHSNLNQSKMTPTTSHSTNRTANSNIASTTVNIKLSPADESELAAKLEVYRDSLPIAKTYKEHREQQRLLKLQEEKLRLEFLEKEKRQQAQKLMVEARFKRKASNDSFEAQYKKYALGSGSGSSSVSSSTFRQPQQQTQSRLQHPKPQSQHQNQPQQPHRQKYVNKFGEIEKKVAYTKNDIVCGKQKIPEVEIPQKTPLTIPTAWEPKSASFDEIIEHLAKMKKS